MAAQLAASEEGTISISGYISSQQIIIGALH
jgi:hypothetical protein